ncbi:hypothetical protein QBC44DRAFT_403005 [Cladorrhinum sp. PSN332]|nr:hypothetical protein QBC44DRAFT_403005 [Cladorrhinum sp. PSN332]
MPQPICQYENSPYVPTPNPGYRIARRDPVPGLRFADRRRNRRRIPAQVPDFTGLTTLPGTSYIPPLLVSSPPDPWHRGSVSSSYSGSSAGETSWDPVLFPQYPEPYPPGLLVDNTNPAPDSGPYLSNNFLPLFATGSPVLSQPSFFIETCMLSTGSTTDRGRTLAARYAAVSALQEKINNPALSTADETIAQAVKLASNDLCYGETQDLRMHIHGIRQMTRLRGGLENLGMNGTLAKMVIMITSIALEQTPMYSSAEISPYLHSSTATPSPPPQGLDPATSALLKDITFLIDTVLALPPAPSEWELQKVSSMSSWVYGRLTPTTPTLSSAGSSLHQSIRLAALIYCRAIQARKPLSRVVTEKDVYEVTEAVWKVPLETWNEGGLLGTLVWVLVGVLVVMKEMDGGYTSKTMLMAGAVQEAMRGDEREGGGEGGGSGSGVVGVLERVVRLQRWLEGGSMSGGFSGSGRGSGSPGGSAQG